MMQQLQDTPRLELSNDDANADIARVRQDLILVCAHDDGEQHERCGDARRGEGVGQRQDGLRIRVGIWVGLNGDAQLRSGSRQVRSGVSMRIRLRLVG